MSKFKVGDKARLIRGGDEGSLYGFKNGDIVTVTDLDRDGPNDLRVRNEDGVTGYARTSQFAHVAGTGQRKHRQTFRLIKGLPDVREGALFQEKCDDGDQDYVLLDSDYIKYDDEDGNRDASEYVLSRGAVENEPQWFVEVFKTHLEYITREELDQWEAFKAQGSTKARKPKASAPVAKKTTRRPWTPAQRKAASLRMKAIHAAKKRAAK
ncbi:hypothetical protein [Mycolicibacterium neoaurum]|uniref:hypothetical protein n=1 Tax=Mycolicibacterium neoaurum TaxID=1795 RepID=UPI001F4C8D16|nr:hypothetical protein [Mycolicibacterium neoaurum]